MKTKLIRIPAGVPVSVIQEAVKRHTVKKTWKGPTAEEKAKVLEYIKKALANPEDYVDSTSGFGDALYDAVFDNVNFDSENDDRVNAINDAVMEISGQLERHLKAFKIDWTEI